MRMWPYHPDLLAAPVPRYTSYPTAADFGELHAKDYRRELENASDDISLYVHIPFCEKICFYCGCSTGRAGRKQRLQSYLAALHREIETVALFLPHRARVRRIAFGGGSPNAISAEEFLALVDQLSSAFDLGKTAFSIELDPRSMSKDWADAINSVGVKRASMGVQTFAAHCQEAIGRVQSEDEIEQSVDWLRGAGVDSLNFDLMYGLPEQRPDDLSDTIERTVRFGADRVALFGYAHVPHIVSRQRVIDTQALPCATQRFFMAESGFKHFIEAGYQPIGFDHFAKRGDPLAVSARHGTLRRNFQGFTDDPSSIVLGLGASAISSFPGLLAQNEKNSGRYRMLASDGKLAINRGCRRSAQDRYRGAVIEQLLCQGQARIGGRLLTGIRRDLQPFLERGLAQKVDEWLFIQPEGLPYARTIAALFDPYRRSSERRFSSAV